MRSAWPNLILPALLAIAFSALPNPASKILSSAKYVEAHDTAGLSFQFRNSPTPNKYLIETMGGGVAMLDYDSDGWLDVFFVNGAALQNRQPEGQSPDKSSPEYWNRLFRNNRDGTFTDVTEKAGVRGRGYGMGVGVGDFNNDGFPDLFVTNYGDCILYRNNGDGSFTDVTSQAGIKTEGWNMSAGFLDYDNDGYLDLFVTRYLQWDFSVGAMVCGVNVPGGRAYCHPNEFKAVSNYLFRNNHDGTFTDVSESSYVKEREGYGLGMAFGDFNNDGLTDIYVANDAFPQFLFKNNGDGTFSEVAALAGVGFTEDGNTFSGMGTDFTDLDNDGFPDILTTALPYEYFAFFRNNGDETFTYSSVTSDLAEISRPFGGWGIHAFDFDNDGSNEVFVATSHVMDNIEVTQPHLRYLQKPLLMRYQGKRFVNVSADSGEVFNEAWVARGAAFGDLDNDGDIDIVVSDYRGPAHLLRNEGGNKNHWITLDLVGRKSNRDALGARVKLTTDGGKVQYRTVSTAGSYASANDRRVAFGIGDEKTIQQISIRWPSGIEQVIDNPKLDQILRVVEEGAPPKPTAGGNRDQHQSFRPNEGSPARQSNSFYQPVQLERGASAARQYDVGLVALRQGKFPEAVEALREAINLRPGYIEAHYALGVAYSRLGGDKLAAAVDEFLEVLRLKPDHIDARVDLSSILAREGDSYAAARQLETALRFAPENPELHILLGKSQYDSRKHSEAVKSFRKALELNPRLSVAHYGIGLVLVRQHESDQAADQFQAALTLDPGDAFSHYELGRIALEKGDLTKAGIHLNEAVHLRPAMAWAYVELGKLYRRRDKPAQAEDSYRAALRYRPALFDALYNLAMLLQAQGKAEEARDYFEKVRALQEVRAATSKANSLNADGIKYTDEGQLDEALAAFRKALAADPSFFMAAYNQGVVLSRQGKKQEAIEAFRTAIRLRPDFVMAHYGLGLALRSAGDTTAEEELRKARLLEQYVAQPLGRDDTAAFSEPR